MKTRDFIAHFGIPGMKWGIRKASSPSTSSDSSSSKETDAAQRDRVQQLKKKKMSQLTDNELRELTNRLQLEKQLKDINPSKLNAGKKFVSEVLVNSGKQVATAYATKYMGLGVEKVIGGFASKEAIKIVEKEAGPAIAKQAANIIAKKTANVAAKKVTETAAQTLARQGAEAAAKKALLKASDLAFAEAIRLNKESLAKAVLNPSTFAIRIP